jgi:hypothetical protein
MGVTLTPALVSNYVYFNPPERGGSGQAQNAALQAHDQSQRSGTEGDTVHLITCVGVTQR